MPQLSDKEKAYKFFILPLVVKKLFIMACYSHFYSNEKETEQCFIKNSNNDDFSEYFDILSRILR